VLIFQNVVWISAQWKKSYEMLILLILLHNTAKALGLTLWNNTEPPESHCNTLHKT